MFQTICFLLSFVFLQYIIEQMWSINNSFISGEFINKSYFPILVPVGIIGNILSFLVSQQTCYATVLALCALSYSSCKFLFTEKVRTCLKSTLKHHNVMLQYLTYFLYEIFFLLSGYGSEAQ